MSAKVYLLRSTDGAVKVGISNVKRRPAGLQCSTPDWLELAHLVDPTPVPARYVDQAITT